jgi:hypothetical protein
MRLLGDVNWYLPNWLQWLPKLNVEGHEPTAQPDVVSIPAAPQRVGAREDV